MTRKNKPRPTTTRRPGPAPDPLRDAQWRAAATLDPAVFTDSHGMWCNKARTDPLLQLVPKRSPARDSAAPVNA